MGGGTIVKEGYLIKSPPLHSKGVKRWQKRYFRLLSTKMFEYYKSKPSKEETPKGQINLEDCKAVNSGLNHNKHKFVFSIELKDRTYFLVADSADEMTTWVTTLCSYCGFSNPGMGAVGGGAVMSGSATLPAGGMPFKSRFRTTSESSTVENFYLASAMQKNVRQQIKQDTVEVKAGTSLSEAFSKKGLRGGSIKGLQTSGGFDMSQARMRSTSVTSTDSEMSLPERSPSLLSTGSGDSPFRRSASSTPSSSTGLTVGKAQTLPPIPADDGPPSQLGGPLNPLYGAPSSIPANPLYNTPSSSLPSPTDNPMYNSPRAMHDGGNPLYKSPTKLVPPQSQYNTPSSIPAHPGPMYNTLPTKGPRSALLGPGPPSPLEGAGPGMHYDTPRKHSAADTPGAMQKPDTSPPAGRGRAASKSHRSALLREFSQPQSEDSDPACSPVETPPPITTVRAPVPKPRPDRRLKEPIPEEEVVAEQQEETPPVVHREAKPQLTVDVAPEGDTSEQPPPVDRTQKPHFEPPKPPVIDRATKPSLAKATAVQEDSSDEEDGEEGEEEFGEVPQQSDDTLHYVRLVHLASPPPAVTRPVPKPRRHMSNETETSMDGGTEYSEVDKVRTSELHRRLSDLAVAQPSPPEDGPCVQDVTAEQPRYINLTHDGKVDEENDPQYYTVMNNSDVVEVPEGHDAYITLIPSGPAGSECVTTEEEDPYTKLR